MAKARQQYFADEQTLAKTDKEFAIENSLVEKINSIEEGAQVNTIETVKVNGVALEPDENKAVDISVPLVEDNLFSIDPDSALSANQGRILWENIYNLQSRGRYLSNWNCDTGLPVTNPTDNPYRYKAGDYYIVSVIAPVGGGHNYRPDGNVYIHNQASSVVEDSEVHVNDMYLFDGTNWLLVVSTERPIAVDPSLDITSHNPAENMAITRALNGKQDTISDLATIRTGAAAGATAVQPGDNIGVLGGTSDDITEGVVQLFLRATDRTKLNYLSGVNTGDETWETITRKLGRASRTNDGYLSHEDFIAFSEKQGALTAGDNIDITNGVISATYTAGDNIDITNGEISATYTAGTGIDITNGVISNTKTGEWGEITGTLSNQTDLQTALDGKVNLGNNQVYDNTVVEIGKWVHGETVDTSGHHVTLDPNGELSTYNVTTAGYNEATLGSGTLELLSNTALGGDETATIDHEKIVANDGTNTNTYEFFGNDRIAKLSDISGATGGIVSDNPYTSSWDGVTTIAPSKNAVYDKINAMDTTIAGKQDTLTAGRNITISNNTIDADVDVDVVRVSTLSDQEAEALFTDLHYHIILYNDDIYLYEKTTTMGGDVFTITNHYLSVDTFESVGTSNSTLYKKTLEVASWGEGHFYMTAGTVNISNVLSTSDTYTTAYTPTQDYNPATKKYVDDGLNSRIVVSSSTPSNPTEGLIWYDTTNDLLKVYDGTNWNVTGKTYIAGTGINISNQDVITADTTVLATQTDLAGKANASDLNTKTFPMAVATKVADAQAAIDWVLAGKNALINLDNRIYLLDKVDNGVYYFKAVAYSNNGTNDTMTVTNIEVTVVSGTVTEVHIMGEAHGYLETNRNYGTPFVPTQAGHPATKKYVDDSISGIVIPTYTAGTGIDIDANNEISADTTVLATQTDLASKADAADIELKVFTLSSTSDVTTGAEIVAWCNSGKIAVIKYGDDCYYLDDIFRGEYTFKCLPSLTAANTGLFTITIVDNSGTITISGPTASGYTPVTTTGDHSLFGRISFANYSPTVPSKTTAATNTGNALATEAQVYLKADASDVLAKNNTTSYTPSGDYNPATKKYVDDSISGIVIPAYTAGTGLTLNNYEFAADTTVLATKADIANLGSFMTVASLPSAASADTHTIYLLGPTGSGADKYEEWIVTNQPVNETFVADGDPAYYYDPSYLDFSDPTTISYVSSVGSGNKGFNLDDSGTTYGYYTSNYVGPSAGWYQYDNENNTWIFIDSTSVTIPAGGYNLSCGGADTSFDSITISTGVTKTWTKIGETSMDLSNYFNKSNDSSDDITEGSTNLFLTPSERSILSDTSGVNTGDETKSSIQTALGAATSSNSGYLTSTDWSTFNGKANASDVNTKTFYISHFDDATTMATKAQDIVDYWLAGKNPILVDNDNRVYTTYGSRTTANNLWLIANEFYTDASSSATVYNTYGFSIHISNGEVTNATFVGSQQQISYLDTNRNYGTPYTPTYAGSPTTKQYVDDRDTYIGTSEPTSNKVEGRLWYDTTNDVLNVYDGTNWNPTGKTYTASTGINISNQNAISADTTVLATKTDLTSKQDSFYQIAASAPSTATATEGDEYYNTTDDTVYVFDGNDWKAVGEGDVKYADFNWVTKTGASITLDLNSTITPSENFTINAPATIKDGQSYILRVTQGATAYTMTLGTNITNPYGESLAMSANSINQYTFLAVGGNLELQPSVQDYTAGTGINISAGKVVSADTTVLATQTDVGFKQDKATSGSAAPATTPTYVGQMYVDTTNDKLYVATGTSSSSDWMEVGGGVDKSWQTATISSGAVTLGIRTRLVPTSNFTLNAPATIIDGEEYVLRCENTTSYTMTLGSGFTNPHNVSGTLSGQATDQFVFLAINGTLELQPLVTI